MDINNLKGVGPKTSKLMEKLNINTINELIEYYPFRFKVFKPEELKETMDNITVRGVVEDAPKIFYIKRSLNRMTFRVNSNDRIINVVIFNRAFLKPHLNVGRSILLYGKYDNKKNTFTASDIKFDIKEELLIEPVYHLVHGISSKELNKIINNAIALNIKVDDYIPSDINQKYNLLDKRIAINHIHNPSDLKVLKKSKLKIIYEELFLYMFKILYLKKENTKLEGLKRDIVWDDLKCFIDTLPFELTPDQLISIKDIFKDLNDHKRMNRLLLGDVGSGKTVVALVAIYANYISSYQSALMVPTEILATQHYNSIKELLKNFNINVEVLLGSMSKKQKDNIALGLENGSIDIVIGTHAILTDNINFKNLGLVITDEQHRFGVNQRSTLTNKGLYPDVLYMSATPIPRTYALTIFGDMKTSIIKNKPHGRKDIKTYVKKESEIKDVLSKMLDEIKKGHQIYVVAPVIEESETNLYDVNDLKEKLDTAFNKKVSIGVLHGKIKNKEKESIMNDFKKGKISILISTTVIEVGIDVPSATMMVIFNSERFGLATLHQLRGRVGRSDLESFCYLICNSEIPRLRVMEESNDGFYISQKDFEMRGSGDLFGVKQSGDMVFKMADLKRDYKILLQVKEDVEKFIDSDEYENNELYTNLLKKINFID